MRWIGHTAGILAIFVSEIYAGAAELVVPSDGIQDATPPLQGLIDSGIGSVTLKRGTYRLTKGLTIDLAKVGFTSLSGAGVARFVMEAEGAAITFVGNHAGTADPTTVRPEVWGSQRMPTVDGIEIMGANPAADGIEATGTMQLTITRTTIRGCRHGIHLTGKNRNIVIADCHLYQNNGIGLFYDNVNLHQSNVLGCHISYCEGGGIVSHGGNVRNLQIGTCDIESNMSPTAPATANVWLDSTGGSIGEVAITGCTIQHSSKAPGCANVRIQGAGEDEDLARRTTSGKTREGNITIGNNVFSDIAFNILIEDARGITITGNTFWEGFERDLWIERSSHIVIGHNNFDRNPRYLVNGFDNAEKNGLALIDCEDCNLTGNLISGVRRQPAAVEIKGCRRFIINGNSILDSDGVGLLLDGATRAVVTDNLISDDRPPEQRSTEPSLKMIKQSDNLVGANVLSNGKKIE